MKQTGIIALISTLLILMTFSGSGQTGHNPSLNWTDSFQLPKDVYIFQKMSRSDSALHIEAVGKKNYYSFTIKNNELTEKQFPIEKKEFWLYQGQGAFGSRFISRKHLEKNIHQIFLKEENASPIEIFVFKETAEGNADVQVVESDSLLHVILIASGKFYDSAAIMHAIITPDGEVTRYIHPLNQLSRLTAIVQTRIENNRIDFLIKSYQINRIEKRAFQRNYSYRLHSIDLSSSMATEIILPLNDSFFYPKIRYFSKDAQLFGTYGKYPDNRTEGVFVFDVKDQKLRHFPFDQNTIHKTRKKAEIWKLNRVYSLHPDMIYEVNGQKYYFLEQFYVKLVGGPVEKPLFHLFYNNVILMTVSPITGKATFNVLPKYQKTFNDNGQISSYLLLKSENRSGVVFNSGSKYLKNKRKTYAFHRIRNTYWSELPKESQQFSFVKISNDPILTQLALSRGGGKYDVVSYRKRIIKIGILSLD